MAVDVDPDKDDPTGEELNDKELSSLEEQRTQAILDHAAEVKSEKIPDRYWSR